MSQIELRAARLAELEVYLAVNECESRMKRAIIPCSSVLRARDGLGCDANVSTGLCDRRDGVYPYESV